ncbi:MAG TPA: glycosyltransferase family 4 protein [bacterium]|nr:glycosyltransferase family 4 protein [bacterium]
MEERALNVGIVAPGIGSGTGPFTYLASVRAAMAGRHLLCNMDGSCPDLDLVHVIDIKRLSPHFVETVKAPVLADVHDDYWVRHEPYPAPDALLRRLRRRQLYSHHLAVLRRASAVIAHSEAVAGSLRRVMDEEFNKEGVSKPPVHVVTLGIKGMECDPVPLSPVDEKDEKIILFLGRDIFRKGFSMLVKALPLLCRTHPRARLVVIGREYAHTRAWARLISRGLPVTFLPHQDAPALEQWFKRARLLVLPSWREAFGLTLIEAMARGVPVVGSRVGGIPEAVEDGVSGLLFERGNANELAEKMAALVGDHELRRRLIAGGLRRAAEFSIEKMAQILDRVYRSVAGSR